MAHNVSRSGRQGRLWGRRVELMYNKHHNHKLSAFIFLHWICLYRSGKLRVCVCVRRAHSSKQTNVNWHRHTETGTIQIIIMRCVGSSFCILSLSLSLIRHWLCKWFLNGIELDTHFLQKIFITTTLEQKKKRRRKIGMMMMVKNHSNHRYDCAE